MGRRVEDCSYRRPSAEADARCGLLARLTGVADASSCTVGRDACEACCRGFPPSEDDLNPVVASLLYDLSSRIVDRGGVAGCDRDRAVELNRWAAQSVPTEEDCRDAPPGLDAGGSTLDRIVPAPRRRSGPDVRSWSVGVTTAPRAVPTLADCLASLAAAGWKSPRLFVDGDVAIPEAFAHLPRTDRRPQIGAWPNYYLALGELLMRDPEADAYMIVQDDSLFAGFDIRGYLERILWPGRRPGITSLFCSRAYTRPEPGWREFEGVWIWCALAFIFPREAAQRFLADRDVVLHRWSKTRHNLAEIDWRVGRWAADHDVPVYYPTPSLVQHIGEVSSLWKGLRLLGDRRATWFAGSGRGADPGK
ncbi:MAG TPA: hypothetical protein VGH33_19150 [Isosphaeraceae bacterium]